MTDTKQPEAIYFAAQLEEFYQVVDFLDLTGAAEVLREQHARITELEAKLKESKLIAFDATLTVDAAKDHIAELEAENQILEEMNQQLREQNEAVGNACASLEAENRALKEQQEAVGAGGVTGLRCGDTKDAKRYRWLRDQADYLRLPEGSPQVCLTDEWGELISTGKETYPQGEALDAAIDSAAAIAQEGGKP